MLVAAVQQEVHQTEAQKSTVLFTVDEYQWNGEMMCSDEEEDVFFDRSIMNKPLIAIVKELRKDQRFDEKVFDEAGALFYDLEELEVKEGPLREVCLIIGIDH